MKNLEKASNQNPTIRSPIPENRQSPNTAPRALIPPSNASPSMRGFVHGCVTSIHSKNELNEPESIANANAFQTSPQKRKKTSEDRCYPESRTSQNPNTALRSSFLPKEPSSMSESSSSSFPSINYSMSELGESENAVVFNTCQAPPYKRQKTSEDHVLLKDRDLPEEALHQMHRILTHQEDPPSRKFLDKMEEGSTPNEDAVASSKAPSPYALAQMPFDLLLKIRSFLDPQSNHALDQTCTYLKDAGDPHHYARSRFLQRQPLIISLQELRAQGEHFRFTAKFALTISKNDHVTEEELQSIVDRFPYITELSLQGPITNEGLKHISQLHNLTTLHVFSGSQITNDGIQYLTQLQNLASLHLYGCTQITDDGIQYLTQLQNLINLDLYECQNITDASLQHLGKLQNLASIGLSSCDRITGAGFPYLRQLRNLTNLDLSLCTQITDDGFQHLRHLHNLTNLDLSECEQITNTGLEPLRQLRNLVSLDLPGCTQITNDGLQHLRGLRYLTTLTLSHCRQISDEGLQHLSQLENLAYLSLVKCEEITDAGLQHLSQLQNLKTLILIECGGITDNGLQHLSQLQNLTTLDLTDCFEITDEGLQHLSQLQNLAHLGLSGCDQITDDGLQYLGQLHELTALDLSSCNLITDEGLEHLSQLHQLTDLDLSDCPDITEDGINDLKQSLPNANISHQLMMDET